MGGAPPWYSNRSPSKRTITEAYPLKNMDRLPSFAVNLDEDPTDIFGAVCALLVCSALLKNCNNYLLDNKTFLWPCLLVYQDRGIQKNVATLIASHHGGSSCSVTDSDGIFSLPSQSCANLETELSNYSQSNSPIPLLPTMQRDDVRQENMATI